jgi:hypothetical protein
MLTTVFRAGVAAAVSVKTGKRITAALYQRFTENVF